MPVSSEMLPEIHFYGQDAPDFTVFSAEALPRDGRIDNLRQRALLYGLSRYEPGIIVPDPELIDEMARTLEPTARAFKAVHLPLLARDLRDTLGFDPSSVVIQRHWNDSQAYRNDAPTTNGLILNAHVVYEVHRPIILT